MHHSILNSPTATNYPVFQRYSTMNFLIVVISLLPCTLLVSAVQEVIPATNQDVFQHSEPTPQPPRCGATFDSATGGIYYKPFESILENERCVWLIGVPQARGYAVNIQYLGNPTNQPNSTQGLLLTGLGLSVGRNAWPMEVYHKPSTTGVVTMINSNILVITFYSSAGNSEGSSGFSLLWETHYNGSNQVTSPFSSQHIAESPTFDFRYPVLPVDKYDQYELTSFVFPPGRNIYTMGNEKYIYLKLINLRFYSTSYPCEDGIHIYNYDVSESRWKNTARFCYNSAPLAITNDDLTLIVFQTKMSKPANETENGFEVTYSACQ